MLSITRRFQWAMGHTLKDHNGPCRNLHGHNYIGYFTITTPELDDQGMILDFGKIKSVIGEWIEDTWDHQFLIHEEDPRADALLSMDWDSTIVVSFNPTAENLVEFLIEKSRELLAPYQARCVKVLLYETENCYAEVTR